MKLKIAMVCGLVMAAFNASACYTVYDRANRVIYHGEEAPVDMSLPLHQTLGRTHPGAQMVFDQQADCRATAMQVARTTQHVPVNTIAMHRSTRAPSNAPLLTDRRTAAALNLPYTVLEGQVVMVPPHAAAQVNFPTLTVVPAEVQVARAPSTATMGAGPAPRQQTVITEMHNPPVTSVQRY
jgi:hypothetical protein